MPNVNYPTPMPGPVAPPQPQPPQMPAMAPAPMGALMPQLPMAPQMSRNQMGLSQLYNVLGASAGQYAAPQGSNPYQNRYNMQMNNYDAEVQNQQLQMQRMQQLQQLNPFYEFEEGMRRGHIPDDMTWNEYKRSKRGGSPGGVRMEEFQQLLEIANNPEKYGEEAANAAKIRLRTAPGAVGSSDITAAGMLSDEQRRDIFGYIGERTRTAEDEKNRSKLIYSTLGDAQEGVGVSARAIQEISDIAVMHTDWLRRFQNKEIDTGILRGFMADWLGVGPTELGELGADQVLVTLKNLGITNLAPVTENELREVGKLFASAWRGETLNEGALIAGIRRLGRVMELEQLRLKNGLKAITTFDESAGADGAGDFGRFYQETYGPMLDMPLPEIPDIGSALEQVRKRNGGNN